ncbi:MAG TPA: PVC-type heme-binding CxxCH protein [Tepidisphaeraceae bacterium]|nr:PVC-type heme-binding CxxCH protein [Tepidisphaeraceae bacterium]
METFRLAPGFRVELVAAEPLIQDPVVIAFDAAGRMWAAEMTSYMPDSHGRGEKEPVGRIVILEDTDADGRMDERKVWLDGLVLPRAVLPLRDGALVGAPPYLSFWRDTNGDDKADHQTVVASDYGQPKQNPEHQANGLLAGLDNWVYSANYDKRFRWSPDDEAIARGDKDAVKWTASRIPLRGQWGHSMDDWGRFYHNTNSDYLRGDLVSPHYFPARNPHHPGKEGVNVQLDKDQTVWPVRPTPAVNRGYRPGFLRPDGSLKEFTAACGPCVYRGGVFPADCDGDVFVCEPSAHLVRRSNVTEDGVTLRGKNAYDGAEFLASTDERFRPVNLSVGPEGALYVVDMYRGILQHVAYLTGYLRELHLRRDMELPVHMGRVYRVVHESKGPRPVERLDGLTTAQLIEKLADPNGWVRDAAQRLIVERQDRRVLRDLRKFFADVKDPRARVHALWALDGLNGVDLPTLALAMNGDPRTAAAGVRLAERFLAGQGKDAPPGKSLTLVIALARDNPDPRVRLQCAFSLSAVDHFEAREVVADMLAAAPEDRVLRDAALSGLAGRELEMLELLAGREDFAQRKGGRDALLAALAAATVREGRPDRVERLLAVATDAGGGKSWQRAAMMSGMADVAKKARRDAPPVLLTAEPGALLALRDGKDPKLAEAAEAIENVLNWPGKVDEKQAAAPPLSPDEQKLFEEGRVLFGATCAACHQAGGEGLEGKAPPLRGSPWVTGHDGRLVRIVLNGVRGPIHVNDQVLNMEMPGLPTLDDRQVAAILTYARREWGHAADPVDPESVAKVREQTKGRGDAWTEGELLRVNGGAK